MNSTAAPLSIQAANRIADMILVERRFQTGDQLPNEVKLAEELGISRMTLREAVRVLCTRGLLEIQRGRGTFVANYNFPDSDLSPLENVTADVRDLLEIRMMVEPATAFYAAKRASDEELETIRKLSLQIEQFTVRNHELLRAEQDFHNAIAMAAHNQFMTKLMPIINKSIYTDLTYFEDSLTYSIQDHREIVRFLEERNAEGARTIMRLHILHCYRIFNLEYE